MHNYFVKNNPVYCRSNPKRSYLHKKHKISHAQQRHSPSFVGVLCLQLLKTTSFAFPTRDYFSLFPTKARNKVSDFSTKLKIERSDLLTKHRDYTSAFLTKCRVYTYYCFGCKTTKEADQPWAHLLVKRRNVYLLPISIEDFIYGWINLFFGFVRNNCKICITIQHSR